MIRAFLVAFIVSAAAHCLAADPYGQIRRALESQRGDPVLGDMIRKARVIDVAPREKPSNQSLIVIDPVTTEKMAFTRAEPGEIARNHWELFKVLAKDKDGIVCRTHSTREKCKFLCKPPKNIAVGDTIRTEGAFRAGEREEGITPLTPLYVQWTPQEPASPAAKKKPPKRKPQPSLTQPR